VDRGPTGKLKEVAAMLKAIHAQEDAQAAKEKARQVVEKLHAMRLIRAAEIVENGIDETLSYYSLPPERWHCIKTSNPLERLMREIRRRTRVVGAFPDGHSALMLVAARLRHVAATRWGTRHYLQMNRLAEVVAIARPLCFWPPGSQKQNNFNPTTFQHADEDRKCEKLWTLPGVLARHNLFDSSNQLILFNF
jgi:hypothetical protein